jgi:hypothetical protein
MGNAGIACDSTPMEGQPIGGRERAQRCSGNACPHFPTGTVLTLVRGLHELVQKRF